MLHFVDSRCPPLVQGFMRSLPGCDASLRQVSFSRWDLFLVTAAAFTFLRWGSYVNVDFSSSRYLFIYYPIKPSLDVFCFNFHLLDVTCLVWVFGNFYRIVLDTRSCRYIYNVREWNCRSRLRGAHNIYQPFAWAAWKAVAALQFAVAAALKPGMARASFLARCTAMIFLLLCHVALSVSR